MKKTDFITKRDQWLEEVSNQCHEFALKIDLDFYAFQSQLFENPELLIIGANPANNRTYTTALKEKGYDKRPSTDLGYATNQYLENPNWSIARPILEMFPEGSKSREVLENAVIMNAVYFNTKQVADLKNKGEVKDATKYCIDKTKEFIEQICKPKNVLFIGFDAPKWLGIKFDNRIDNVLQYDEKSFLVQKKVLGHICYYKIHHTSRNPKFNNKESLHKKREFFKAVFQ